MSPTAIYWTAANQVELRRADDQLRPGPGEVLIANEYSLISPGSERDWLSSSQNHFVLGATFPFIPGYSAAGRIAALGDGVDGFKVGDRVVATPAIGAHASHLIAEQSLVFAIPEEVSTLDAVLFNLGRTAAHTVRLADIELGASVAIVGQGPVGLLATQIAKARGANPIVAVEIDPSRRDRALSAGATLAVDPRSDLDQLWSIPGGIAATIDLTGTGPGLNTALQVAGLASVVVLSTASTGMLEIDYGALFLKGLVLKGAFIAARPDDGPRDINVFLQFLADGRVDVSDMTGQVFTPERAPDVYARVIDGDPSLAFPIFDWSALT